MCLYADHVLYITSPMLRSIVAGMLLFIGWVGRVRKNLPGVLRAAPEARPK